MSDIEQNVEGEGGACPKCKAKLSGDPLMFAGSVACTQCETGLWFLKLGIDDLFYVTADTADYRSHVMQVIGEKLNYPPDQIMDNQSLSTDIDYDSLEMIELAMELEEELGLR